MSDPLLGRLRQPVFQVISCFLEGCHAKGSAVEFIFFAMDHTKI
ncbi:hypothetical protein HG15A2_45480 [Adhaeretor mobilis]|uniref:Uncharacterized protein n=1 Tax=Adhaeretor mobilis TaxID=1930276 RepID=A0A517N239_9BACT|nr:hypothetical protein HG15A2_45480 [Adhaeretor mobilis]